MVVMHNILAMNANRNLGINGKKKAAVTEKLSSGYKINRSADDAAGLSISEKMRRQIRGLTQGVQNSQDGISLCQVADGALSEVTEMLHRITELSVKAANGTNQQEEREYIQDEINQLLAEINRVGDTTKFNDMPIFKGYDEVIRNADGSVLMQGDIPFNDFTLADLSLGAIPFNSGSGADHLQLQAIVNNANSAANGKYYNLIYGSGSTSSSSFRVTNADGQQTIVQMSSLSSTNYTYDQGNQTWSRDFNYTENGNDITITQKVRVEDSGADEKNYIISYDITNNQASECTVEFMFHADTAYNNNDRCEGYFISGARVDNYCVYSGVDSPLTSGATSSYVNTGIPDSFSIVDVDNALAFSEKIAFDGMEKPDSISIGHYNRIDEWPYYSSLDSELGINANRQDLGFSLYYNMDLDASGVGNDSKTISFMYGIVATEKDNNLSNLPITKDSTAVTEHFDQLSLWIQSGCDANVGLDLIVDEMNTEVLGIHGLDVSSMRNAGAAMEAVKGALEKVSSNRSKIGAQQNRMEHIIANQENIVENTTAAESRIRDTDMAKATVEYSNRNILEQVGQAMLSQANQSNQGVLNLLN